MAVKQVKIGHQSSTRPFVKSALEAIKLEICFLKDLEHPNVVQFLGQNLNEQIKLSLFPCRLISGLKSLGFEETSQNYNIFLEYVEGGSIGSCVSKNGKLEPEVVKSFTKQILKGLEYLHSCCIMHRVIRLPN
jgi:mitogen-activated protein kinase kinase kinase